MFQVVEVQARSGLPHLHRVAWQQLSPDCSRLLALLQAGTSSALSLADLRPVVELGAAAITVSTSTARLQQEFPALTGEQVQKVVQLMATVQIHHHTASCTTEFPPGQDCREFFPRLHSLLNLVARQPDMAVEEQVERMEAIEVLHWRVQKVLRDKIARGAIVPVIKAADTPNPPLYYDELPGTITLQGGQQMRRVRVPRVVDWCPCDKGQCT